MKIVRDQVEDLLDDHVVESRYSFQSVEYGSLLDWCQQNIEYENCTDGYSGIVTVSWISKDYRKEFGREWRDRFQMFLSDELKITQWVLAMDDV